MKEQKFELFVRLDIQGIAEASRIASLISGISGVSEVGIVERSVLYNADEITVSEAEEVQITQEQQLFGQREEAPSHIPTIADDVRSFLPYNPRRKIQNIVDVERALSGKYIPNLEEMTFGEVIRHYREEAELTLEEVAKLSGLSKGYLSEIENGIIVFPRKVKNRKLLARALGIPEELIESKNPSYIIARNLMKRNSLPQPPDNK